MEKYSEDQITQHALVESQIKTGRFRWFDIVMRRWSHLLQSTLYDSLGILYEVATLPSDWMRFREFTGIIEKHQPIYIFEVGLLKGCGLMVVNNKFAHQCLCDTPKERLAAQSEELPPLNPQKQKKIQNVLERMMIDFSKSWDNIFDVQSHLKKITTHTSRARVMAPFEKCVVGRLLLRSHGTISDIILCFPYLTLDGLFQKLNRKKILPPEIIEHQLPELKDHFQSLLEQFQYELSVEIGNVKFKPESQNSSIKVGDILPVQSVIGSELIVKINQKPVLTGEIGVSDENYAIKVSGKYEEKKLQFRQRPRPFTALNWPKA